MEGRYGMDEDMVGSFRSWINVAQNLKFPFNRENRYHEEYDGYDHERQTGTFPRLSPTYAHILWNMYIQ